MSSQTENPAGMNLYRRHTLVLGLGSSGAASARFLKSRGASVTVTDRRDENALAGEVQAMRETGVHLELGGHPPELLDKADLIVLSPGVPHRIPFLETARQRGIPVIGEMELAFRFIAEPVIAVTGTNGKTTTTTLLGKMLSASGLSVFVGGNIGTPLIDYVAAGVKADRVVVEVSSFQLDTIETFRPRVGVLLNISEDHLDRYPDFRSYVESKGRLFENQQASDVAVLNAGDPSVLSLADQVASRRWRYNSAEDLSGPGAILQGAVLICHTEHSTPVTIDLSRLKLQGRHNWENVAAAALAALAAGATPAGIQSALEEFQGLSHRLEPVMSLDGVRYVDDSKATNVDAVIRALDAFDAPVILIMGGRDKGSDYQVLTAPVRRRVKRLIAMGESAGTIQRILGPACQNGVTVAASMDEAVRMARQSAAAGDVVLLSPAGSSFDMYRSYAARGEDFCRAVRQLTEIN